MYQVTGKYPDLFHPLKKRSFHLNPDQPFVHFTWKAPIHWEGIVGGHKVRFTQVDSGVYGIESFEWNDFPKELDEAKHYIVEAIDEAMRIMD